MDRNLGAPDVNYHGSSTGSVYYQFGRKDPFEGGTLYKPDGSSISISAIAWNSSAITQESSKIGKNVPYSIQNPLKFITSSSTWTTGDQYCPLDGGTFMWQDPKSAPSADGKVKKSIFDPCPSGWMVPQNGTWDDLRYSIVRSSTGKNGVGNYYYPAGMSQTDIYAYYSASGYRNSSNGSFSDVNNRVYSWSSSPSSTEAFYLLFTNDGNVVLPNSIGSRANGFSVRCIQEYF